MSEKTISYLIFISVVISLYACINVLNNEINEVRQDITELRKDFSYDPKDAK